MLSNTVSYLLFDPQGKDGAPGSQGLPGDDGRPVSCLIHLLSKECISFACFRTCSSAV